MGKSDVKKEDCDKRGFSEANPSQPSPIGRAFVVPLSIGEGQGVGLSRKKFLKLSGVSLLGSTLGLQTLTSCGSAVGIQGQMVGANHAIGHLLRKAISLPISQTHRTKILIIGSGISGLTAGYFLQKAGIKDYEILELESHIGGNSTFGEDAAGRYPWAAHYLPIPSPENKELIDFLSENKIITGFDENDLPIYDEYALCFHPDERLFVMNS